MNYQYDLMISYCWAEKIVCKKIFEQFNTKGYRIWFDENDMHGNSLSAMANAIENSQCIIVCMSENYEKSNACRHEAEFAYVRQRFILPLVVQPKYKPLSWLGFIIGARIYVDFTKHEFDRAFGMLEAEMKSTEKVVQQKPAVPATDSDKKKIDPKKQDDKTKDPTEKKQVSTMHETKHIDEWTSEDVINWCYTHNLLTFAQLLEYYDGASLLRLHNMAKTQNDNDIFRLLQDDCKQLENQKQMKLTFTEFIRFQTELNKRLERDAPQSVSTPRRDTKTGIVCSLL